ncbi:SHOCT domain-containing protein [Labilibaculum euxinus]
MDPENMVLYGLAAIAGFFILRALYRGIRGRQMLQERLLKEYRQALNGTDRQKALATGRAYFSFLRGNNELAQIDEQMVANDMKAMPQEKSQSLQEDSNDIISKLERLAKLKEQGVLSDAEFHEQKAKVLSL